MTMLKSIKAKIVAAGILLVALTSGVVTTALYLHSKAALIEQEKSQHQAAATRLAAQFDQNLGTLKNALTRIAQSIPPDTLRDPGQLEKTLANRPALFALFPAGVAVVDAKGNTLFDLSESGRREKDVAGRAWFRQVAELRRTIISEPFADDASPRPSFVLAAPLGEATTFAGAIVATVYLDAGNFFSRIFQADDQAAREARRLFVVSRPAQVILASSDPRDIMRPVPMAGRNAMVGAHMSGQASAIVAANPAGLEELSAASSLTTMPWTVVVATSSAAVLGPVDAFLQQALLWGILSALAAASLFWLLASRLLAPAATASRIIRRQLADAALGSEPLPGGGNDEIGVLLDGFNRLYDRLQSTASQLSGILENTTVGVVFVKDRELIWANRCLVEMFGYSIEEMAGQSTRLFYPSQEAYETFGAEAYAVLRSGGRFVKELPMRRKDGGMLWARISGRQVAAAESGDGSIWILEDITDRRQAEAALRASEASLRTIADYTYDWEYWLAPDGRFRYVSPSCERITGYTVEEFMDDPELLTKIVDPADAHAFADHIHDIDRKDYSEVEFRIRTKTGALRWIAHVCGPVYDHDGRYQGRRGSNRDVTAAKEAELEYRTIVQTAQDGFLVVAQDTRFLDTNDAYCRMLGYHRDELLGMQVADIEAAENPAEILRHTEELHRTGHAQFETRHRRKDGSVIDVEVTAQHMDLHGGVLVTFVRDITERKRAELAVEMERRRLQDFSTSSADWFWEMDADLRFCYLSENFESVYGLSPAIALGKTRAELLAKDRLNPEELLSAHLEQLDRHLPFRDFEYRIRDAADRVQWISVSGLPYQAPDGRFAGYRGTGRMITERKLMEAELEKHRHALEAQIAVRTKELLIAKEAAEAANVAKSAFLANMSHEMRTPLHQLNGLAALIRREPLTEKQVERMDKLDAACRNLTGIIDAILELTNLEARKFDLRELPVDLESIVGEAVAVVRGQADAKRLFLQADVGPMPAGLCGDAGRIKMALLNYLTNAIRFTLAGSVSVRARLEREDGNSALIRCEVEDTGIGIDPADQSRLFSIFEQLDNSPTRPYGGLGVGLAMTRKIAQLMGGDAGCDSRPGEGSLFWFTMRLKKG